MTVYDSKRLLTIREIRKGDKIHGGMLAGKCVEWTCIQLTPKQAFLKFGDTVACATGKDLRDAPYYLAGNCPMCELQHQVTPQPVQKFAAIPRELLAADVPSSFRFRAAQFTRRNKAE